MPIVRWNYKTGFVPFHFAAKETQPVESDTANRIEYVDPRFLSFDYTINYSGLRKFPWIPRLAYDDGKKTYMKPEEPALCLQPYTTPPRLPLLFFPRLSFPANSVSLK
jgi:hypothetical protein